MGTQYFSIGICSKQCAWKTAIKIIWKVKNNVKMVYRKSIILRKIAKKRENDIKIKCQEKVKNGKVGYRIHLSSIKDRKYQDQNLTSVK